MKKLFAILSVFLGISSIFALNLDEIKPVIQKNIDESLALLKQNPDKKAVAEGIFAKFDSIIDYKLMAKLSLSKHYKELSLEQQSTFNKAYEASLKKSFSDKLTLYKDQNMLVKNGALKGENRYLLTAVMNIDGEEKNIIFKFYKNDENEWFIYDFDILGVSIIQTYRSQFGDIFVNEGFDSLLKKLEQIVIE